VPPILKATASVVAVMVQSFSTSTAFTGGGVGGGLGVELVAVSVCLGQFLGLCMVCGFHGVGTFEFLQYLGQWWPSSVAVCLLGGVAVMASVCSRISRPRCHGLHGGGGHGVGGWCAAPRPVPRPSPYPVPPRWRCASVVAVMVSVVSVCLLHVSHMVPTVAVVS